MDRKELLRKAAGRLIDSNFAAAKERSEHLNRDAKKSVSPTGSGWFSEQIENALVQGYSSACVSVLDKIQLEDRDNALELAEEFRTSLLEPAVGRFASASMVATLGERPGTVFSVDPKSPGQVWYRRQTAIVKRLKAVQANVVEEFQLAVTRQSPQKRQQVHMAVFVDPERIEALRAKTSVSWDFSRLIALCEELNTCWLYGAHHAVAMLTRAILDHVPPLFGQPNFSGVANQYAGGKSFSDVMKQLDKTAKAIADGHLHNQIRQREALPTATQVDCRQSLDALLAELIRITP